MNECGELTYYYNSVHHCLIFEITLFPRLPYVVIMGLSPYGWYLIFHEAFVEHCQEPPIGFGKYIL